MNETINKINEEIQANEKDPTYKAIGDYLIDLVKNHTAIKEKILDEKKTIKGAIDAMRKEARKVAVNNVGMLPPQEGFAIVKNYYGIDDADLLKKDNVSVLDFDLNSFI